MRDFLTGLSYLPRGFRLLGEPRLRRFVAVPILINVLVFAALFYFGAAGFDALLEWLLPDASRWAGEGWWNVTMRFLVTALEWLLWPVFVLVWLLVMFYSFTLVANLLGSPFNSVLAARVEELTRGVAPAGQDLPLTKEVALSVGSELRKYGYFAKLALPLLILSFIPVVNLIAGLLWATFGAWAAAIEYVDYPLGNHGLRFQQERELLRRRRGLALGFGFGVVVMTLVPLLNLLAMPTAVIAATLLCLGEGLGGAPEKV